LGAKNFGFSVSARIRGGEGVESARTFCGQGGRELIFQGFARTSSMDGP